MVFMLFFETVLLAALLIEGYNLLCIVPLKYKNEWVGSSLEFVTFKLKEHWNAFLLLIKIYSAKFTSIKKQSTVSSHILSLYPGYLRLIVSSLPGSQVFLDTLAGKPCPPCFLRVQGDPIESAVKSACLEKIMYVSSFLHCVIQRLEGRI